MNQHFTASSHFTYCYLFTKLCPTLSDPMDCSLPGSSIHGIFQAGVLEWGAIAFSDFLAIHMLMLSE